jgi:BirA family transcriptional regulator, biotin operon repressor / biotin---[acetyl-CoA-carboxylase] ligase
MDFRRYVEEIERRRARAGGLAPENLVLLARVDSTNRIARAVAAEYEREGLSLPPLLILALEQTGGRGRHGRPWASPRGRGVYATRVVAVEMVERLQSLPLLVGVGLCRALSRHLPAPCLLKWPNDRLVETRGERRKIGGILIESLVRPGEGGRALVGFGVNHSYQPGELPETATSVRLAWGGAGGEPSEAAALAELVWDLVAGVERELGRLDDPAYAAAAYREHSVHRLGERIVCRVAGGILEGTFAGFDDRGLLLLDRNGEELRLSAGEVIE